MSAFLPTLMDLRHWAVFLGWLGVAFGSLLVLWCGLDGLDRAINRFIDWRLAARQAARVSTGRDALRQLRRLDPVPAELTEEDLALGDE